MNIPKIKYNDGDETIYCTDCKRIIQYNEKYVVIVDDYDNSEKPYHLEHAPAEEDEG